VIEACGAQIIFLSGVNNEAGDALSRLDTPANNLLSMHECFLNRRKRVFETNIIFPQDFSTIAKHQKKDKELKKILKRKVKEKNQTSQFQPDNTLDNHQWKEW